MKYGSTRQESLLVWPPSPGLSVALVVAALGLAVWWTGAWKSLVPSAANARRARPGTVAVPVSGGAIPAYAEITRDHLWDPRAGEMSVVYLPKNDDLSGIVISREEIIGRVLKRDKPAGYVFMEADFLPKGTRPGIVAGIPAGKRAIRVDVERVAGLQGLQRGDRFDLVSAIPLEAGRGAAQGRGDEAAAAEFNARLNYWRKQANINPIAQNAVIVEPASPRSTATTSTSLTKGPVSGSKVFVEAVIALTPEESVQLTEALAINAQLICLPRSGRPDEDPAATLPPQKLRPQPPVQKVPGGRTVGTPKVLIETINGSKRQIVDATASR